MKKLFCVLLAVYFVITLAACGNAEAGKPDEIFPTYEGYTVKLEDYTAKISLQLPRDWEYRSVTGENLPTGARLGLLFYPAAAPDVRVYLYCNNSQLGLCGTGKTFEDLNFGEDAGRVIKSTEIIGETRSVMVTWEDKPPLYYAEYDIPDVLAEEWEPMISEILSSAVLAEGIVLREEAEAAAAKAFDGDYESLYVSSFDHVSGNWYIRIVYTCDGNQESVRYTVHADGTAEPVIIGDNNMTFAKPVLYLYPTQTTDVTVKVANVDLTCTYPAYNDGWTVTASPDGTLINHADGREYSYLFWEGMGELKTDFSEGFCVRGEDTAAFLQQTLSTLGLTPREYNEFIVWWLPQMQDNPYNLISFAWDEYDRAAPLEISPAPDTLLRVFMVWQASDTFVDIPAPTLPTAPERDGFTVIEWGGTEITG